MHPPVHSTSDDFNGDHPHVPSRSKLDPHEPNGIHSRLSRLREFARQNKLKQLGTAIERLDEAEERLDTFLQELLDSAEGGQAEGAAPVAQTFSFRLKPTGCARVGINDLPPFEISAQLASLLWALAQDWGTATDEIVAFKPRAVILERASAGSSAPLPAKRLASIVNKLREAFAKHGLPKSLIETDRKRGLRLRVLRTAMSQSGSFQPGG